jgi:vacuolar-type H+-ATPase subunit E/Vma4
MSLEKILHSLETEAERQIIEIERETQLQIEQIRAQAGAEAETVRQKHLAAIRGPLQAEQVRLLNQAKLKALQILLSTREELIASALQAVARCLADLPLTEAYPRLVRQLAQEAVDTLGPDQALHLRVSSRDVALMRHIIQEMGLSATVEGNLEREWDLTSPAGAECLGGLIATTAEGRISLVNTLAARLQRAAHLYRSQIAELVLSSRQEG